MTHPTTKIVRHSTTSGYCRQCLIEGKPSRPAVQATGKQGEKIMASKMAQRAAVAAASVTLAAAGSLATGAPASAAAPPTDDRANVVSHHVQLLDTHDDGRIGSWNAGRSSNDNDDRRRWISDQIEWNLHHDRNSHRTNDNDDRQRWVTDQIEWNLHHNGPHLRIREHEGRSHR
ncbi:hypothetical protein ACIQ6K_36860 [Streptomyces sp. NPDC096354]|uniref:hypothetical protein n=1 Tax=Streptomyces sp. NPDC096354 TaxID=3366088 RepID=UPI003800E755